MKRIFLTLIFIFAALFIGGYIIQGNPWLLLMVLLGGTIGIAMGLMYPFPIFTKLSMILGLIASVALIYFGFKNHKKIIGQIFVVIGILGWLLIGIMGLSTGT